jgi:hypothetical protein
MKVFVIMDVAAIVELSTVTLRCERSEPRRATAAESPLAR